jgi:thioredoxin-like negative regulator of GroEL
MLRPRRPTEDGFTDKYPPFVVVSFSAKWCKPCLLLDKETIVKRSPGVAWYHCDVDVNDITLGYCGLSAIPSFVIIKDGDFKDRLEGPANANVVLAWLSSHGVKLTTEYLN